jgi:hypothetical protein
MKAEQKRTIREVLEIDPTDLNDSIIRLPATYYYYSEKWFKARAELSLAKAAHDLLAAELHEKYTKSLPASSRTDSPTVGQIKSAVERDKKYVRSRNDLIEFDTLIDKYQSVKEALKMQRDMLELTVQMKLAQLGSTPKTSSMSYATEDIRQALRKKKKGR